jgi:hypothetical protein
MKTPIKGNPLILTIVRARLFSTPGEKQSVFRPPERTNGYYILFAVILTGKVMIDYYV